MIEINLLGKKGKFKAPVILGIDLGKLNYVGLIIAFIIYSVPEGFIVEHFDKKEKVVQREIVKLNKQLSKVKKDLKGNKDIKEKLNEYNRQIDRLKNRAEQVDKIIKQKTNPKLLLEKIAKLIPQDMWFDELQIDEKKELFVVGGSSSYHSIGNFISSANGTPFFKNSLRLTNSKTVTEKIMGRENRVESYEIKGKILVFDPWAEN